MFGIEDDLKWEMCYMRLVVDACATFIDAFEQRGKHVIYPTKEHCAMADAVKLYLKNKNSKLDYVEFDSKYSEKLINELAILQR